MSAISLFSGVFAAFPGALALVLLVPVIWWLHRGRRRGDPLYVSSLLLFERSRASAEATEPDRAARTDPAWIRRALLVLALAAALAGFEHRTAPRPIVVWIDGSPSMQTREGGVSRLGAALAALNRDLAARSASDITLRALARPGFALRASVPLDVRRLERQLPRGAPVLPDLTELDARAEQWLVTDGAAEPVVHWLARASIDHLVQSGRLTENAAIVLLAYRSSLKDGARGDVLVGIHNGGTLPARRHVELLDRSAVRLGSFDLTLAPEETRTLHFATGAPPLHLEARLSPPDQLPDDDSLAIDVPALDARVAVDPACGAALESAVAANPAIVRTREDPARPQAGAPRIIVDCSGRWRESRVPTLFVRPSADPRPQTERVHWRWRLPLPQSALANDSGPIGDPLADVAPGAILAGKEALSVGPGDELLMSAGSRVLAVLHPHPIRRVETVLDLRDGGLAARAQYPLLVAALLEATAGEDLLGRVTGADRVLEGTRIAPDRRALAQWRSARHGRTPPAEGTSDWTPALLALVALLLIWECVMAVRALWVMRRYYLREPV